MAAVRPGRRAAVLALAAAAALGVATNAARAQPAVMKWAHVYERHETFHQQALWAAERIAERTAGRWRIEVFPAAQLGTEPELNVALAQGQVDIVCTGLPFAGRVHAPLLVVAAPYVLRDAGHWEALRTSALWQELAAAYATKSGGQHIAALTYYGRRHLTANRPVRVPEDLRGMKLRVPDAPLYRLFPAAFGAEPTPIAFAALYLALKDGLVDAQENPLATIESLRLHEVQKHLVLTGHAVESLVTLVGAGAWGKLSEDDRRVFDDVLMEAATRTGQEVRRAEEQRVASLARRGMVVLEPERAPFAQAVQAALTADNAPWPKALLERMQALK